MQSHDYDVDTAATADSCTQWTMSFDSDNDAVDYIRALAALPQHDNMSFTIISPR
jgi:hypothetical protein